MIKVVLSAVSQKEQKHKRQQNHSQPEEYILIEGFAEPPVETGQIAVIVAEGKEQDLSYSRY